MSDSPKVVRESGVDGGDSITVKSGGTIEIETGGQITGERIERKAVSVSIPLATAASTVVLDKALLSHSIAIEVKRVAFVPDTSIAGHATANGIISVLGISGAAATVTDTIASVTFTTGNATAANIPRVVTLTTSVVVAADTVLVQRWTFTGAGANMPAGGLTLEYVVDPA